MSIVDALDTQAGLVSLPPRRAIFSAVGKLVSPDLLIGKLDRTGRVPLHTQVYTGLRDCILDGRLRTGASMPSTRSLPAQLGVSRNTVLAAYEQLQAEGFIESRIGSGTYVASSLPDMYLHAPAHKRYPTKDATVRTLREKPRLSARGARMLKTSAFSKANWRQPEAFYPGLPDYDLLPMETWRKLSSRHLNQKEFSDFNYSDPGGYRPLRNVIAEYLNASRGVRCLPEQVIIVSGAQQGLDLAAQVLLNDGDDVLMEDPGYSGANGVFDSVGANVIPVPVDHHGMVVEDGLSQAPNARMAFVTPSHQYPLGHQLSTDRRKALLSWAVANQSWIIEDDYDCEIRYEGRPQPAIQGMPGGNESVIYLGTFSKVLFPSLRIGYMVVPEDLVDAFLAARSLSDRHQSTFDQSVLADFIVEGHFTRHLRRSRTAYAERQQCMLDSLEKEVPGLIHAAPESAGMSLVGWLPEGMSDTYVAETLAANGIYAPPLSQFSQTEQPRGALLLGYTGFNPDSIRYGVKMLGRILHRLVKENPGHGSGELFDTAQDRHRNVTSITSLRRNS